MSAAVAHAAPLGAAPARLAATPAAGPRPRAGGGLRVRVPLRLVAGVQYSDAALAVYIKIAALAMRPEGCTAAVSTLADYLGTSKSTVERALKQLARPDAEDGTVEVLTTRRTLPGGRGQTAHRAVRPHGPGELYVWIPARAATSLPPRLLRLYALITYAQTRRIPLALADLADVLRHQSGRHTGEPLGTAQTSRLLDDLAATGWATVRHREGLQGRHAYEAHPRPLRLAPPVGADIHDGSGPDLPDGSLVSEEDPRTDRPVKNARGGRGIRRRRLPQVARGPVDNPAPAGCGPQGGRGTHGASSGRPADGSGPTLSARAWTVLEPVRHLLDGETRGWEVARIEREIARQLATGTGMRRITDRLQRRHACTDRVRHGARWILGAGLPRATGLSGCQLDACEDGTIWHTGAPCGVCADLAPPAQPPAEAAPAPASAPAPPSPPAPASAPEQRGGWVPAPRPAFDGDVPPVLTRAQALALREQATTAEVRAAIGRWGRALAIELYGWRLVGPLLPTLDDSRDGGPDAC
ncbi:helix-turn-helix domain-containing protein [Streptomyces sp. NPDC047968]|uniref:helix-turn-helix domain-containing protein n=2 Tax=Streptomyces TaxID=1883 RepID=UPI0034121320